MDEPFFVLVYPDGKCVLNYSESLLTFPNAEKAQECAERVIRTGTSDTVLYLALVVGKIENPKPQYVPLVSKGKTNE